MCSAAALPNFINVQSDVRNFSIGSRWLYEDSDLRLDASTYAQEAYEALRLLENCPFEKIELDSVVRRVYHPTENQARSNFKRIWAKENEGIPFLTGKQLFFLRPDKEKFVSRKMKKIDELMLPKGTILLTRSGTTGFPVLVNKYLSQFAITDDVLRIFPGTLPIGYIYAYLASSVGRPLVTKGEYGSTVDHLEAKHVTTIPIPLLPEAIQKSIHKKVLRAYALRDRANQLFDKAEQELYELLGISSFTEDDVEYLGLEGDPQAFELSSLELADRLDATHHVPVSRSTIHKLEQSAYKLIKLSERVSQVHMPPRLKRIPSDEEYGIPFLQGSHIPSMNFRDLKYISTKATKNLETFLISPNWVLLTRSGTVGRLAISTKTQNGWAASEHILRIIPRESIYHPGFLCIFLSTPYGQHQLKARIYGGVVDELTPEDAGSVLIPDVPFSEQEQIGQFLIRVYELRDEANAVEDEAIAELETMISG